MNAQLSFDLEPRTHARRTDPRVSHEAAAKVAQFATGHCLVILQALRNHGRLTVDQIASRTNLQSQQINKRTADLHKVGAIRPTGEEMPSASGRMERVWEAV